jgi:hypothetical protein
MKEIERKGLILIWFEELKGKEKFEDAGLGGRKMLEWVHEFDRSLNITILYFI